MHINRGIIVRSKLQLQLCQDNGIELLPTRHTSLTTSCRQTNVLIACHKFATDVEVGIYHVLIRSGCNSQSAWHGYPLVILPTLHRHVNQFGCVGTILNGGNGNRDNDLTCHGYNLIRRCGGEYLYRYTLAWQCHHSINRNILIATTHNLLHVMRVCLLQLPYRFDNLIYKFFRRKGFLGRNTLLFYILLLVSIIPLVQQI